MKRDSVISTIEKLPEEFSMDELVDHLYVLEKIEKGQKQVQKGETFTEEEAEEKLSKWL